MRWEDEMEKYLYHISSSNFRSMKENLKLFAFDTGTHLRFLVLLAPTINPHSVDTNQQRMDEYFLDPNYQANYCEENIWHLGKKLLELGHIDSYVCFLTNPSQTIPIWFQKKCPSLAEPVIWGESLLIFF